MSYNNTGSSNDDPHGVQQLLAILRRQQDGPPASSGPPGSVAEGDSVLLSNSIASTESQSSATTARGTSARRAAGGESARAPLENSASSNAPKLDLRYVSFAQALPILTQLSKDDRFLQALLDLKRRQDGVEESLAKEYKQLTGSAEKAPDSQGEGASQRSIETWSRNALRKWDDMYASQQKELQTLGVPCFFVTNDPSHRRRQERVFDVLAGLLE